MEAHIDFPEEEIEAAGLKELSIAVNTAVKKIVALLDGFAEGKALREGVSVVIAGKPNVGKSSLLNTLLREKRAIVTSIPGTTRDVIEEVVNIRGLPVRMLDTAGICKSADPIEQEGVAMALEKISQADLVLFMVDASRFFDNDDLFIGKHISGKNILLVMNKCDQRDVIEIPVALAAHKPIRISTLTGEGIDSLHQAIYDRFLHGRASDSREYVVLSNVRHRDALDKCLVALRRFMENADDGFNPELLAADLRDALHAVGEVTGETTSDGVLDLIFQRFCIGK